MVRNIEETRGLYCPFNASKYCSADSCMAWKFDVSDDIDIDLTNKYATKDEIEIGIYSNPIFKASTTLGLCSLIDPN